ncbi:MAG: tyrosine-type recombinase/integrase [Rhodomicrobium sp.]
MKKIHVRKLRDMKAATPIGANNRVKEISALFAWAVKYDLATTNPAEKFEKLRSATNGLYTWTEQDVERFEDYWPVGSRPRLAMAIMLYLGVRRSDAVLIGRKQESRDGETVTFQVFKGHKRGSAVLTLPILPPLRAILDASALGHDTWLETSLGVSYSAAGFGNAFKDWCREADLPQCNCHGLRKIGAVRAAEAGASEHELMAMFGWEDADMARIYTRKAAQRKLAASGAAKLTHATIIVPPPVSPMKTASNNNEVEWAWRSRRGSNPQPPA